MNDATQQFLQALWQYKPEESYFLIWSKRRDSKQSHWCQTVAQAAAAVEAGRQADLYVGCALSMMARSAEQRVGNEDAAGIPGVWVDIDIRSEVHQAKALPATAELALQIIPHDIQPTVLVRSGNGLHAWWLFREPWIFEGVEEREVAAKLLRRWQALLRMRAAARGWSLDHTHDLARLLRLPGTLNHKSDPPRMVSLLAKDGPRYDPSDLEEILDQHNVPRDFQAARRAALGTVEQPELTLHPDAAVDHKLLELLLDASLKFRATWQRQRWDLHNGDASQSHYDLAIANFGLDAGLPEQLIVNLMIEHRRGNPDFKARRKLRQDYYRRTLDIAYQKGAGARPVQIVAPEVVAQATGLTPLAPATGDADQEAATAVLAPAPPDPLAELESRLAAEMRAAQAGEGLEGASVEPEALAAAGAAKAAKPKRTAPVGSAAPPPTGPPDEASRVLMCEYLSDLLGVRILRIVKVRGKEPSYHMELHSGKVEFPKIDRLLDQQQVRLAIAAHANQLIRRFRAKEWDQVAGNILAALTEVDGGMDMEFEGAMRTYLHAYLQQTNFVDPDEQNPTFLLRPMILGGQIAITVNDLLQWLGRTLQVRVSPKDITSALVAIGATPIELTSARQSRWRLPSHDWLISEYESAKVNFQRRSEISNLA